jgi:hypothetical protein
LKSSTLAVDVIESDWAFHSLRGNLSKHHCIKLKPPRHTIGQNWNRPDIQLNKMDNRNPTKKSRRTLILLTSTAKVDDFKVDLTRLPTILTVAAHHWADHTLLYIVLTCCIYVWHSFCRGSLHFSPNLLYSRITRAAEESD